MFFPCPRRAQGFVKVPFGVPAQVVVGEGGVGPDGLYVAFPARSEFMAYLDPVDLFEACNQFEYRNRYSRTDVEYFVFPLILVFDQTGNSRDMGLGKVYDIYIVTQAGPVRGVIVVPKMLRHSRIPAAVCVMKGTRLLGTPRGSSPIRADGCAPIGLK